MAIFVAFMLLLLPILTVWWLISPKFYPFGQNSSRIKITLHSTLAFLALLITLIITIPPTEQPVSGTSIMVGFFTAGITLAVLAYLSVKAKKSRLSIEQRKTNTPLTTKPQNQPTATNIVSPPQVKPKLVEMLIPPPTKTPEPKIQKDLTYFSDKMHNNDDLILDASSPDEVKLNEDLPQIGSIRRALYEMDRKQAEEQQAELERKSASERLLARSESARQALKAINEQKKAESCTTHHNIYDDEWDGDVTSGREQCEIHYTDLEGNFSIRDVEPVNVRENSRGATILVAIDINVGEFRYFHLDRIELVSHNGNDYTKPRDIERVLRKLSPECD
ncbi:MULTISPECIES: WYL domain-containing protein [unclassified Moraxella]|uniref:WYL domain-containing protein n=1 Tax=unclassified Moraxella TaxID=2685852 RepID=UPI00359D81C3